MRKKTISKLKKYNITNIMIANWLDYKDGMSFNNSSAKNRIINAIESIITYVEDDIVKRIED
jgi:hypothetical protein